MNRVAQFIILTLAAIPLSAPAETPAAKDILATYEQTVGKLSSFRMVTAMKSSGDPSNPALIPTADGVRFTVESTIYHDSNRWKISRSWRRFITEKRQRKEERVLTEVLVSPDYLRIVANFRPPENSPKSLTLRSFIDAPVLTDRIRIELAENNILFGTVRSSGEQPLWDEFRSAEELSVLPEMADVEGKLTYVVTSRGKYGLITLWLDPSFGNLPRRIEIRKQAGDTYGSRVLVPRKPASAGPSPTTINGPQGLVHVDVPWSHVVQEYKNMQLEEHQGIPVLMGCDYESQTTDDDGTVHNYRQELRVRSLVINPDTWPVDAFQPSIPIPNHYIVNSVSKTVRYRWVDGKVIQLPKE
jgi:hypothetical protein